MSMRVKGWKVMSAEEKREFNVKMAEGRKKETEKRMRQELEELVRFTRACRPDMHEPDEHGIGACVVGNHLDNAFGNSIVKELMDTDCQEFVVILENENTDERMTINLANLIALARKAVI